MKIMSTKASFTIERQCYLWLHIALIMLLNLLLHRVSKKLRKLIFLSELCQISTNCKNFGHEELFWRVFIFHLT